MKTIEEYQKERREYYNYIEENKYKTGILCPICKNSEMINVSPGEILCSNPPQKFISCPKCDHREMVLA